MEGILKFLSEIAKNNDRVWFNTHKDWYLQSKQKFEEIGQHIIDRVAAFDPSIGSQKAANCTYRIYRDVRFSQNKAPYKTHFGLFIVPKGRKSGYAGYYLEATPNGQAFLAAGHYIIEPKVLKLLREDISYEDGKEFLAAVDHAQGFDVDFSNALKKVPKDFEQDKPYSQYLRLKNFCLLKNIDVDYLLDPNFEDNIVADFAKAKPFLDFVNRAITYTQEGN